MDETERRLQMLELQVAKLTCQNLAFRDIIVWLLGHAVSTGFDDAEDALRRLSTGADQTIDQIPTPDPFDVEAAESVRAEKDWIFDRVRRGL